ncbi:MAG: methyltransferase domain-containing protein [Candidatus Rokubacteria bacterium]|nr:methyltransferase domain-containing protein [Candidatus Rokubacteria bacterium]
MPTTTATIANASLPLTRLETPVHGVVARALERAIARAYGATYDAIVRGFAPYEALLDTLVARLAQAGDGRPLRVLDIACGTGTAARRLARAGHTVVGIDTIAHLIDRARRVPATGLSVTHADIADGTPFAAASFDACVSLHTLNWHPRPAALLAECRRVLRPGGHALFFSYQRAAAVRPTFAAVRGAEGWAAALHALRWLVPTAVFEAFRHYDPWYPDVAALHEALATAGFDVHESRPAFLAGVSRLVWARATVPGTRERAPSGKVLA